MQVILARDYWDGIQLRRKGEKVTFPDDVKPPSGSKLVAEAKPADVSEKLAEARNPKAEAHALDADRQSGDAAEDTQRRAEEFRKQLEAEKLAGEKAGGAEVSRDTTARPKRR